MKHLMINDMYKNEGEWFANCGIILYVSNAKNQTRYTSNMLF